MLAETLRFYEEVEWNIKRILTELQQTAQYLTEASELDRETRRYAEAIRNFALLQIEMNYYNDQLERCIQFTKEQFARLDKEIDRMTKAIKYFTEDIAFRKQEIVTSRDLLAQGPPAIERKATVQAKSEDHWLDGVELVDGKAEFNFCMTGENFKKAVELGFQHIEDATFDVIETACLNLRNSIEKIVDDELLIKLDEGFKQLVKAEHVMENITHHQSTPQYQSQRNEIVRLWQEHTDTHTNKMKNSALKRDESEQARKVSIEYQEECAFKRGVKAPVVEQRVEIRDAAHSRVEGSRVGGSRNKEISEDSELRRETAEQRKKAEREAWKRVAVQCEDGDKNIEAEKNSKKINKNQEQDKVSSDQPKLRR